eukprot:scaffold192_cov190-Pinguiococcus_pyrenoidosus.AAC.9
MRWAGLLRTSARVALDSRGMTIFSTDRGSSPLGSTPFFQCRCRDSKSALQASPHSLWILSWDDAGRVESHHEYACALQEAPCRSCISSCRGCEAGTEAPAEGAREALASGRAAPAETDGSSHAVMERALLRALPAGWQGRKRKGERAALRRLGRPAGAVGASTGPAATVPHLWEVHCPVEVPEPCPSRRSLREVHRLAEPTTISSLS